MGYKGTIRSVRGAVNRANRESQAAANRRRREQERQRKQIRAMYEKLQRKRAAIDEKRNKPAQALKELYASGKIEREAFEELITRDHEITIDLIVFGRNAGVKLSERYLSGKINNAAFEELKNEILGEPEAEKDEMVEEFKAFVKGANDFVEQARGNIQDGRCSGCSRSKKLYWPLFKQSDFKLCALCKLKFKKLCGYPGRVGQFYTAQPVTLTVDRKADLILEIKNEHILNYS